MSEELYAFLEDTGEIEAGLAETSDLARWVSSGGACVKDPRFRV
jgi:hypothetical protein